MQFGNAGQNLAGDVARCGQDTFAVTGWLSGPVSFDGYDVIGQGLGSMFLAKVNLGCKVEWATGVGGSGRSTGYRNGADSNGRIAVSGWFSGDALFGHEEPNETWLHELADGEGAYQAVYEADGSLAWAQAFSPTGDLSSANGVGIAFLGDGSVIGTGVFKGQVVVGEGSPAETVLLSQGDYNAFLVRYDSEGELLWARREGGPAWTRGESLAALPDGSFLLLGTFDGEAFFGQGQGSETTLMPSGQGSVFLARFQPGGDLEWVIDLGVNGHLNGNKTTGMLSVLQNGDVVVTGDFYEGSMPAGDGSDVSPVECAEQGLFLSRYGADGSRIWTRVILAGSSFSSVYRVVELSDGSLVAAGRFRDTVVFAMGEPNETTLHGYPVLTGFLAAWSGSGDFLWALLQGGTQDDSLVGLAAFSSEEDDHDIFVAAGYFKYQATYGTGGGDEVTFDAAGDWYGGEDIVILRFDREAE
jgi:hypothetical protein